MAKTYTWSGDFCTECPDKPPIFICEVCGLIRCERDETPSFILIQCPECSGDPQ